MSKPVLVIEALRKSYGTVRALDGLDVRIESGAVGLLGPNGAGKTTLLKLLLGLLSPDGGSARIAGEDPSTPAGRLRLRRFVGYMPESDCLIPGMSAVELVSTLGRLSGLSNEDSMTRAHEVLDYVGLDEARYREMDGYSTGMKQRLKLAQALVHDPALLLLDEPTNGLDPKGRRHMLDLIGDLGHAHGKSLLLCSHLLPDVERTCRDVVVLQKGRVVTQGSIEDLTRADRGALRVRVVGESTVFLRALVVSGFATRTEEDGTITVTLRAGDLDADPLFAVAVECGTRLASVEPIRSTLEDVFLRSFAGVEGTPA